jgi:hypothetical protein
LPGQKKVGGAASPPRDRTQPAVTPNALSPITTTAPDTRLQQPAMAKLIASAKKCSSRCAVMMPPPIRPTRSFAQGDAARHNILKQGLISSDDPRSAMATRAAGHSEARLLMAD